MALAWGSIFLSYLAALGHLSSGDSAMSLHNIFNADTIRTWLMYRGVVLDAGWGLSGWHFFNSTYLLDVVVNWLMFGVGGALFGSSTREQFLFGMYAMPLVWVVTSAYGWVKVCRLVWGNDACRATVVILGHALPFLFVALGEEYLFTMLFLQVSHTSTWAVMPWLLLLWLKFIACRHQGVGRQWLKAASLALFIVTFADFAIAAWFTVPTMLAVALTVLLCRGRSDLAQTWRRERRFVALSIWLPMLLVTFAGNYLSESLMTVSINADFSNKAEALRNFGTYLVKAGQHTPALLLAWGLFVAGSVAYLLRRFLRWMRLDEFVPQAAAAVDKAGTELDLKVFMPLWLTGVICGSVIAGIMGGLADPLEVSVYWGAELRYYLPAFWMPFMVGGALLPWQVPARLVAGGSGLVAAASFVALAAHPPSSSRLDPFNNAFQQCFVDLATQRGWEGGMGSFWHSWLLADPEVALKRYFVAIDNEQHGLVAAQAHGHPAWGQGRFDFFVVSDVVPVDTMYPPLDPQARTCNGIRLDDCMRSGWRVTEDVVREFTGGEHEIVRCGDVRIAAFASPQHLNFNFR